MSREKPLVTLTLRLHDDDMAQLRAEVREHVKPLYDALDEATELLADAMNQACHHGPDGWLNTMAISTWDGVGDWLVEHASWECDDTRYGFYRPPQEPEATQNDQALVNNFRAEEGELEDLQAAAEELEGEEECGSCGLTEEEIGPLTNGTCAYCATGTDEAEEEGELA